MVLPDPPCAKFKMCVSQSADECSSSKDFNRCTNIDGLILMLTFSQEMPSIQTT